MERFRSDTIPESRIDGRKLRENAARFQGQQRSRVISHVLGSEEDNLPEKHCQVGKLWESFSLNRQPSDNYHPPKEAGAPSKLLF